MKLSGRDLTEDPGAGTETESEGGAGAGEGATGTEEAETEEVEMTGGTEETEAAERTGTEVTGSSRSPAGGRSRSSRTLTAPGNTDSLGKCVTDIMMLFTSLCVSVSTPATSVALSAPQTPDRFMFT